MAHLRDIRRRIKSIHKTQQVTRAMKMVAAAKLRRAQEAILHARPYANKLRNMISWILLDEDLPEHPLLNTREGDVLHLLVISGERGFCGGFNTNIFREVESIASNYDGSLELTVLGKKGVEYFQRRHYDIKRGVKNLEKVVPVRLAGDLAQEISSRFINGSCHKVAITYTEFRSALTQRTVTEWLLPMEFDAPPELTMNLDYIFHPDPVTLLNQLLPRYINSQIFRAFLESQASEYGARMTAMDSATRNSEDMIAKLTLQYNRARQASITKELIEIVSGAEALKG